MPHAAIEQNIASDLAGPFAPEIDQVVAFEGKDPGASEMEQDFESKMAAPVTPVLKINKESKPKKATILKFNVDDLVLNMPKPLDWDNLTHRERLEKKRGKCNLFHQTQSQCSTQG